MCSLHLRKASLKQQKTFCLEIGNEFDFDHIFVITSGVKMKG